MVEAPARRRRTIDDLLHEARARLDRLNPRQALAASRRGGLIVDIRSEAQRMEQGLVPNAWFVPRNVLEWRADPACTHHDPRLVAVAGPLVLMCGQGYQSSLAAATLQEMGIDAGDRHDRRVRGVVGSRAAGARARAPMSSGADRRRHWDHVFEERGPAGVSWYERSPRISLAMIDLAGTGATEPVLDVGGGASPLPGALLARGLADVTVLDVSEVALRTSRSMLGDSSDRIRWIHADVLEWSPERTYGLWHDRALFHFLVDPGDRERYVATARSGVRPGGHIVVGTFAKDGPATCSGLPVARYDTQALADAFGDGFALIASRRDEHLTPGGAVQAFTWIALRRLDS